MWLSGLQSRSGHYEEERNLFNVTRLKCQYFSSLAPTELMYAHVSVWKFNLLFTEQSAMNYFLFVSPLNMYIELKNEDNEHNSDNRPCSCYQFYLQVVHHEPFRNMNWNLFHLLHNHHSQWNMAGKVIWIIIKMTVNAWSLKRKLIVLILF